MIRALVGAVACVSVGVVPYAHGVLDPGSFGGATEILTGSGWVLSAGFAVRWRHLVVEQWIHQIEGADGPLKNGENAPLMIGWRF